MAVMLISSNLTLVAKIVQEPRRMERRGDRAEVGQSAGCSEEGRSESAGEIIVAADGRRRAVASRNNTVPIVPLRTLVRTGLSSGLL